MGTGFSKNPERTGITVQERGVSHWPNLAIAEETTERNLPQLTVKHIGVVIGFSIKILASPQT